MVNVTTGLAGLAVAASTFGATPNAQGQQAQILIPQNGFSVLVVGQDANGQPTAGTAQIDLLAIDRAMAAAKRDAARANDAKKAETALGRLAWSVGDLGRETFGQVDADNVSDLKFVMQPVGNNPQILNNFYAADGSVLPGVIVLNANQASLKPNADGTIQAKMDQIYNPATTPLSTQDTQLVNTATGVDQGSTQNVDVQEVTNVVTAELGQATFVNAGNSTFDPSEAQMVKAFDAIKTTDFWGFFDREIAVVVKTPDGNVYIKTPSEIDGRDTAQLFRVTSHDVAGIDREAAQIFKDPIDLNGNKTDLTIALVDPVSAMEVLQQIQNGSATSYQATVRRVTNGDVVQLRNLKAIQSDQIDHAQRMQQQIATDLSANNSDLPVAQPLFVPHSPPTMAFGAGDPLGMRLFGGGQNTPAAQLPNFAFPAGERPESANIVLASALEKLPVQIAAEQGGLTSKESAMAALLPSGQFGGADPTQAEIVAALQNAAGNSDVRSTEAATAPAAVPASESVMYIPVVEQRAVVPAVDSNTALPDNNIQPGNEAIIDAKMLSADPLPWSNINLVTTPSNGFGDGTFPNLYTTPRSLQTFEPAAGASLVASEATTAPAKTGFGWGALLGTSAATLVAGVLVAFRLGKSAGKQEMQKQMQKQINKLEARLAALENRDGSSFEMTDLEGIPTAQPAKGARGQLAPTAAAVIGAIAGAGTVAHPAFDPSPVAPAPVANVTASVPPKAPNFVYGQGEVMDLNTGHFLSARQYTRA